MQMNFEVTLANGYKGRLDFKLCNSHIEVLNEEAQKEGETLSIVLEGAVLKFFCKEQSWGQIAADSEELAKELYDNALLFID